MRNGGICEKDKDCGMFQFLVCFVYEEGLNGFWRETVKHSQGVLYGLQAEYTEKVTPPLHHPLDLLHM